MMARQAARGDGGAALVLAVMAVALLTALGVSLSVLTSVEMRVSANYAQAQEVMSAAETALELASREMLGRSDWASVASGLARSTFTDGLPGGSRTLSDGAIVDLTQLTAGLSDTGWRLFSYGALSRLNDLPSDAYIVVWVRPDPEGRADALVLRADALGTSGARRGVQCRLDRAGVLSWMEVR